MPEGFTSCCRTDSVNGRSSRSERGMHLPCQIFMKLMHKTCLLAESPGLGAWLAEAGDTSNFHLTVNMVNCASRLPMIRAGSQLGDHNIYFICADLSRAAHRGRQFPENRGADRRRQRASDAGRLSAIAARLSKNQDRAVLERKNQLRVKRSRLDEMRAAEGGEKIVECGDVGQIGDGQLQTDVQPLARI